MAVDKTIQSPGAALERKANQTSAGDPGIMFMHGSIMVFEKGEWRAIFEPPKPLQEVSRGEVQVIYSDEMDAASLLRKIQGTNKKHRKMPHENNGCYQYLVLCFAMILGAAWQVWPW